MMRRTGAAVLLIYALLLAATVLVVQRVEAAVPRYSANVYGSILLRGNTNLVCPVSNAACLNARQGQSPSNESLDNNSYVMRYADADGDPVTTFNDSTATVSLPPGSTVLFAALYWAADTTAGDSGSGAPTPGHRNRVQFRTPVTAAWQQVTASTMYGGTSFNAYQGFADVTALVAGAGSGVYRVANLQSGTGKGRFAGWTLAVAYRNPAETLRALRVYEASGR
jgi:hypothetical protein